MSEQRQRNVVFGEAVEQYDATRPGYPTELVSDVLTYAGLIDADSGAVLEVGAGTGKASMLFAARGLDLTCVEPDPRMAAVLARNCQALGAVTVVVEPFESWRPSRSFALLYAAQSWHWVDPERRVDLAHAALAPGGALALFWNKFSVADRGLHAALLAVDAKHGLLAEHRPHAVHAQAHAGEMPEDFAQEWPELRLADDERFSDLRSHRYRGHRCYPTAEYRDLLASISLYRMLDPELRAVVMDDVSEAVDAHGGTIDLMITTDLALARRLPC